MPRAPIATLGGWRLADRELVLRVGLRVLHLAALLHLKALLRARFGLQLWHRGLLGSARRTDGLWLLRRDRLSRLGWRLNGFGVGFDLRRRRMLRPVVLLGRRGGQVLASQLPGALSHLGVGREDHEHLPALHPGRLLDHRHLLEISDHLVEHGLAQLLVGDFPAAEHDRHSSLVALFEEAPDVANLESIVVLFGLGPQLHFLEVDNHLLLLRLGGLLLLLVLEAAVVHDLADRRLRHRVDLDQVKTELGGFLQGCFDCEDSELLTRWTYDAHLPSADPAIGSLVASDVEYLL